MKRISLQDIKFDLLKIIEPFDGVLADRPSHMRVVKLFNAYLNDLQSERLIFDSNVYCTERDNSITLDVNVRMHAERSPKKLKIHVGLYKSPWRKAA